MTQTHTLRTALPTCSASPSWPRALLARWRTWRGHRQARAAFQAVLALDDRMLCDIGVTREEAEWAAGLPLSQDASTAMHARARTRRGRAP